MTLIRSFTKRPLSSWVAATAVIAVGASLIRLGLGTAPARLPSGAPLVEYVRKSPAIRDNVAVARASAATPGAPNVPAGIRLARTAAIALLVPDVERTIASLRAVGVAYGGAILSLTDERPVPDRLRRSAAVSLAVPSAEMDAALGRIAALGGVRSRTETAEDVSTQIVDDDARLRNLRRTEADMRRIMDRSGKIGEVLEAEEQLSTVREQIETLAAEVSNVRKRVAFASIAVELTDDAPQPSAPEPSAAVRLADAWRAAVARVRDVSIDLAACAFGVIAFAPYWLVPAVAAIAMRRRFIVRRSPPGGG